jgi:hypothetical protein
MEAVEAAEPGRLCLREPCFRPDTPSAVAVVAADRAALLGSAIRQGTFASQVLEALLRKPKAQRLPRKEARFVSLSSPSSHNFGW